MFNSNCGATVPLVANVDGNNNGMFGGDGLWGLIIILALLGWGGNGFGGLGGFGGGRQNYATPADLTANSIVQKLDGITYGISDATFALSNSINNGFHGVDNAICTLGYQNQQGFSNLASQMASCCCGIERAIDGVNYNMATQACDTRSTIQNATRDIIDNQNCNTRSILDFLVNDKLATLQAENQNLKLQASQAAQNAYLLNELKPCPIPSYTVCNPYTGGYGYGSCGCV